MQHSQGHRRGLLQQWTTAMIVGELVGFVPPAVTGATLVWLGATDLMLVIGLTIAGLMEGLAIGVAQAGVLRRRLPALHPEDWVSPTVIAAGFAWFVGMGGSALVGWDRFPTALAVALLVPGAVLALLSMGYLQWRVLRRFVPDSFRWVPVTAAAWMIGVAVPVVALSVIPNQWPLAVHIVVAVLAAVGMGLVVGLITGRTLVRLLDADGAVPEAATSGHAVPGTVIETPPADVVGGPERATGDPSATLLALRFGWTALSCFVVESVIVGLAALPAAYFFRWHLALDIQPHALRLFLLAAALLPAYLLFALLFMWLSAEATALLRWRPPPRADLPIAELPLDLRRWARYAIMSHLVRVVGGPIFRSTPIWVWYMRRNGAKIGKHVWINSLQVGDECLLDFGDEVVIGSGVHLSGHTVERGLVRLAPVVLGPGTNVGVGAHVGIGVTTGAKTQIGSMSVVPKHAVLEAGRTYAGIPVRPVDHGRDTTIDQEVPRS